MACNKHLIPAFGCAECINADKAAMWKAAYDAWQKQYCFPKCKVCGGSTKAWEWDADSKRVKIVVGCANEDAAERSCADEDFFVEVPL